MQTYKQTIDGKEYFRTDYNDRLVTIKPVNGWSLLPKGGKLRKALIKAGFDYCQDCGSTHDLQAHHIRKIAYLKTVKGHYYQDPQANHSLANGAMLCRTCHTRRHSITL